MASGGYEADAAVETTEGILFDFTGFKVEETMRVLMSGQNGLKANWDTGVVKSLEEGSSLEPLGIKPGMRIVTLDGQPYATRLMNRKVALQKDFVAVFATSAVEDYDMTDLEEGFLVKTFKGGGVPSGMGIEKDTGRISKVDEGSQAADHGVCPGMLVRMINNEPFAADKFSAATTAASFEAVILKIPQIPDRNASQVISRSTRSLPDEWNWQIARDFAWMQNWNPDARVPDYLRRFGFEAEDCETWRVCPSKGFVKLALKLETHEERPKSGAESLGVIGKMMQKSSNVGATWYSIECVISKANGSEITSWLAPRRLEHIKKFLEERVRASLGPRYEWLFEDIVFPDGKIGTTKVLNSWLCEFAAHINDGVVSPSLCALMLSFLMAPITSKAGETPAPDLFTGVADASEEADC